MALSKIDVANMLTGATPVANGGTALTSLAGFVKQVVQGTKTNQFETTATSFATSGLEVAITPSATSSKILIMASTSAIHTSTTSAGGETLVQFYKNHASISSTAIGDEYQVAKSRQDGSYTQEAGGGGTAMFLDSPSTTEEITYTVFAKINSGTNGRIGQNNHGSTITVMEVLA
jgi:hypothetical protein|tara:strand:- start:256 stop:780 length:525 start_codon:yes stop_codon:yes gene_type:complete